MNNTSTGPPSSATRLMPVSGESPASPNTMTPPFHDADSPRGAWAITSDRPPASETFLIVRLEETEPAAVRRKERVPHIEGVVHDLFAEASSFLRSKRGAWPADAPRTQSWSVRRDRQLIGLLCRKIHFHGQKQREPRLRRCRLLGRLAPVPQQDPAAAARKRPPASASHFVWPNNRLGPASGVNAASRSTSTSPMSRRRRFVFIETALQQRDDTGWNSRSDQVPAWFVLAGGVFGERPSTKRRLPVSISKHTHPKAQMSARLSTASPLACSGLMYEAVPTTTPSTASTASDFASPKSRIFVVPSLATLMLDGFRSRWTIPR